MQSALTQNIQQHLLPEDSYVITSGLDSDDMLAKNYVDSIYNYFKEHRGRITDNTAVVISLMNLYKLEIEDDGPMMLGIMQGGHRRPLLGSVRKIMCETSHNFLSLRLMLTLQKSGELNKDIKTVRYEEIIWLYVIHKMNTECNRGIYTDKTIDSLKEYFIFPDHILSGHFKTDSFVVKILKIIKFYFKSTLFKARRFKPRLSCKKDNWQRLFFKPIRQLAFIC